MPGAYCQQCLPRSPAENAVIFMDSIRFDRNAHSMPESAHILFEAKESVLLYMSGTPVACIL